MTINTIQIRKKGSITLPIELRNKYSVDEGDVFTVIDMGDGSFLLTPHVSQVNRLGDRVAEILGEEGVSTDDLLKTLDESANDIIRNVMPKIELFFDSSALIAGIISAQGAARALLLLSEDRKVLVTVSEQVITEVERNIARKAPKAVQFARELILASNLQIVHDPPIEEVLRCQDWIDHPADVPILVAAVSARVDFLVTLNTRHFIDNPEVSRRSHLQIGTPGDALSWTRRQLSK